jgi:hypothetical protein
MSRVATSCEGKALRHVRAGSQRAFVLVVGLLASCTNSPSDPDVCAPFADLTKSSVRYEESDWGSVDARGRPRVVVLTDFSNEPDDAQSLVRFLVYSNEFDVEGILATTSTWMRDEVDIDGVREHVEAYGRVRETLLVHSPGYPPVETLRARVHACQPVYGMQGVGPGRDTEGSDHILRVLDQPDDRPIWVSVWGGSNCLAQALWKLSQTRTAEEVDRLVSRLRVYSISDQDDSGACMRAAFPKLSYIVSPSRQSWLQSTQDYGRATWPGISADRYHYSPWKDFLVCPLRERVGWPCDPAFRGPRFELVDEPWLEEHVRSHGPLGARYRKTTFIMEGDTPSFLNLVGNGLAASGRPDWGGWGGRYELARPTGESRAIWTDAVDTVVAPDGNTYTSNKATIWRWREAYQSDFAARMDWSIEPDFASANHNPTAVVNGDRSKRPIVVHAAVGDRVRLSAGSSTDPDGDHLDYEWWFYPEAGSPPATLTIEGSGTQNASLVVPDVASDTELHVILEVEDDGFPSLRSYRRLVVRVGDARR